MKLGERYVEYLPLATNDVNSNLEPINRVNLGLDAGEPWMNKGAQSLAI